ncbi:metallophosphoesterase family protein [Mucilaginibacter mali]|uniref:Metallophosphoesterase family protein n=1 Tax=Mucilaginibacter mali TaxID=2740462 RepID=A0A7D4TY93_9SPHI|nr:metallophosphoesterase family protein [Mucilaginibacter mali]QKJ31157.1 metallophosphoesterase family protein [Mucilaginibacter mali]
MQLYAIISDIHGNALALEAVLADIKSRGISNTINLGDFFFGALEPEKVADLLRQNPMLCITGNTDREILEAIDNPSGKHKPGMDRVVGDLSDESINWMRGLPKTATCDSLFFVCHGTPESDNEYLLEKVTANGVFVYNDEDLIAKTQHIAERIILCGHSHVNRMIWLSNGKIILNPGSVGLPAYLGTGEHRFAMESMTPHAKYAIVSAEGNDINIEQVLCTYDWKAAAETARQNGNPDAARFLLHGRMPKDLRVVIS